MRAERATTSTEFGRTLNKKKKRGHHRHRYLYRRRFLCGVLASLMARIHNDIFLLSSFSFGSPYPSSVSSRHFLPFLLATFYRVADDLSRVYRTPRAKPVRLRTPSLALNNVAVDEMSKSFCVVVGVDAGNAFRISSGNAANGKLQPLYRRPLG